MLVLDTANVSPAERAEAFQTTVSVNCTTSAAQFEDPSNLHAEMHVFDLGPTRVFNIDASGTILRRTPQMARAMNECPIALALPMKTTNHLGRHRDERVFSPRDLILVDLSAPYEYGWSGDGASYAFHVDYDQLGLPMDTIHAAAKELRRSPIYSLVRDHIVQVTTQAEEISDSGAAAQLAEASIQLMHALIVSAADDVTRARESMHASMPAQVQAYIRTHLRDPELTPARIASANGISVRALYKLCEASGSSLEQSIIHRRLRGARADLGSASHRHQSISAIALAWGFVNPSFFSSRFRLAFEMSPRQWRATAQMAETPQAHAPEASAGQQNRDALSLDQAN